MSYLQSNELYTAIKYSVFHGAEPKLVQEEKQKKAQQKEKPKEERTFDIPQGLDEAVAFKRDFARSFPPAFDSEFVEKVWNDYWEREKFATANAEEALKADPSKRFVIILPPPNVTGSLHIGHALTAAIQDSIVRRKRMQGFHTVYLPGTDHAGIATQSVVEKMLAKEGVTKHSLGKEKFLERVWQWKEQYGNRITMQLRRLGSSLDWTRFSFTMDPPRSLAVCEAFVRLHERGLIYRDKRIVNWDCHLLTAVSDIEVEDLELTEPTDLKVPSIDKLIRFGELVKFAYPLADGSGEIVVATTRIETMLGDVAVAVHSGDERYKHMVGKELQHPLLPRKLKVITDDELVDPKFGTGAVKITPAHDPNDYLCGRRNNLDFINIMTDDGKINENGGQFKDLPRYEARIRVNEALEKAGKLRGVTPNPMVLKLSSKSGDPVEPLVKPQWYVKCGDVAKKMIDLAKNGELKLIPEVEEKKWYNWLSEIRDWCISRQLWWGHQIPAYRAKFEDPSNPLNEDTNDAWVAGRTKEEAEKKAKEKFGDKKYTLQRDEDVLDTWFSSGLLPFSNFGWPNDTPDLKAFYPNTLLETGNDILFFWVARMVMFGLLLTDKCPYQTVFLHSLVRDEKGEKMSKSKGNVIDPLEIIDGCTLETLVSKLRDSTLPEKEKESAIASRNKHFKDGIPRCGTDALRYALLAQVSEKDIHLSLKDIIICKQFANKIWNSYYRVVTFLPKDYSYKGILPGDLAPSEQWILSKLNTAVKKVNAAFDAYKPAAAVKKLKGFWYKFCDNYLEYFKNVKDEEKRYDVLFYTLEAYLRLLHPVMPFLTEELYQKLPGFEKKKASISIDEYPEARAQPYEGLGPFKDIIKIISLVNSLGIKNLEFTLTVSADNKSDPCLDYVLKNAKFITHLTGVKEVQVVEKGSAPKPSIMRVVRPGAEIAVVCKDPKFKEKLFQLEKETKEIKAFIQNLEKKINAPDFKTKTPANVQLDTVDKCENYKADLLLKEETVKLFKEFA